MKERKVIQKVRGVRATDGAGVRLVRVLGNETMYDFDPFLMLDSFDSDNPDDYRRGFPEHPVWMHPAIRKYGLVMVSTGIMKLEKRVARDASNSTIKIKR